MTAKGDPEWGSPRRVEGTDWAGLMKARLFEQRIVFLRGELDHDQAGQLAAELMTLDALGDEPISLHIDGAGGSLEAAFTLIDTIDLLGVAVNTICVGRAEGAVLAVLAVADRRSATPHARMRLSEPRAAFEGAGRDIEAWARHHSTQVDRFVARLAQATHQPDEHIEADMAAGRYFDAEEACGYRLIDEVLRPVPDIRSLSNPRAGLGFSPGEIYRTGAPGSSPSPAVDPRRPRC